jgi:hypothetical protein
MNRKKVIIGVLMAAIFIMMAFVPVANNSSSGAYDKYAVAPSIAFNNHANRNVSNLLRLDKYRGNVNVMDRKINMYMAFQLNGRHTERNQTIIERGRFGTITVISLGNMIYMNMTILHQNSTHSIPGDCIGTYYKYPDHHESVLFVMKIPVVETSDFTAAKMIAFFGGVFSDETGSILSRIPWEDVAAAAGAFAAVGAALAVDYIALDTYATASHDATVYFDTGASWGTEWYNSYEIGVYGEEGAFTGTAQSHSSGIYIPLAEAGGKGPSYNSLFAMDPHSSVWNPFDEPPW